MTKSEKKEQEKKVIKTPVNKSKEEPLLKAKEPKIEIKEKKITEIEFLDFLRENKKFHNLNELKEQILLDKQKAINLFQQLL